MPKGRVLVVDNDADARRPLEKGLVNRGHEVISASTGEEGIDKATRHRPDVIVLDVDLPDIGGMQACQEIRKTLFAPIIMTSARSGETDIVLGLGVGADYYLIKPLKVPELIAHIEAALRREKLYSERRVEVTSLRIKDLILDLSAHELKRNQDVIALSPTEFRLVHTLARNAGSILTRDRLLDCVWELRADGVFSRTVDVHVGRIRRKMGLDPENGQYIVTVAGIGYKMPAG